MASYFLGKHGTRASDKLSVLDNGGMEDFMKEEGVLNSHCVVITKKE